MHTDIKDRLNVAFTALRKQGLVARQKFSCCCGCAGSEIATDISKMPEARKAKVQGCVFYTRQDAEGLDDAREPGVYLAYGPVGVDGTDIGKPATEIGALVVEAMTAAGLKTEWDGKAETRIWVDAAK